MGRGDRIRANGGNGGSQHVAMADNGTGWLGVSGVNGNIITDPSRSERANIRETVFLRQHYRAQINTEK